MNSITLRSPAKLNLYLHVHNKRPDGFHNITTVFERINLFDDIRLTTNRSGKIKIFCSHQDVPKGPKNLVYRVAKRLRDEFSVKAGVDITIKKQIPVAAGLAGGSSNAATTLMGLNRLWRLGLSQKDLMDIAPQIGSDVAFFLADTSWALGTNKGDRIKRLSIKTELWHILVVPKIKVYTPQVYQGLNLPITEDFTPAKGSKVEKSKQLRQKSGVKMNVLTKKNDNVNILIHNLSKMNIFRLKDSMKNDLEKVVLKFEPNLKTLKEKLNSLNTQGVMISGSGPSVFGITESEAQALDIKSKLHNRYKQVFVVKTL